MDCSECRKRQGFRGGRNFGLNAEHAAGTFLGKWNFFAGERVIKRDSIIVVCIRRFYSDSLVLEMRSLYMKQRRLRIKTFWNIRSERYMHDIWLAQWIKVCKRSSEQTRTFPPTCPCSNIEKFTSILEYLRQSCQYWPVSVVSVNFDHRSVTPFHHKRRYWQTSMHQYWYGNTVMLV